ncbi:MAG: hypothetical protein IT203_06710 [Fimbriimonadaceae bacterium]|nr:hypothetical protein [Fimbriimonadaceae bacterium]
MNLQSQIQRLTRLQVYCFILPIAMQFLRIGVHRLNADQQYWITIVRFGVSFAALATVGYLEWRKRRIRRLALNPPPPKPKWDV